MFDNIYHDRRVLVTGHTGFKGSWLCLWLKQLGAHVTGVALDPGTKPNHWELLRVEAEDLRIDVRRLDRILDVFSTHRPEIVFHLAAQPLVRRSYRDPLETISTNVLGTANVLEGCRQSASVQAAVIVTTDKVYANQEWPWGYRESDRLGGHDPYSASKACAELVTDCYRNAFFSQDSRCLVASVRAGNVIGGGDWSEDRLVPDLVRSITANEPLVVRSPNATRPWQHVLESLTGYLLVGWRLLQSERAFASAWNFGPNPDDNRPVLEVLDILKTYWPRLTFSLTDDPQPHETRLLYLDNARAKSELKWQPIWTLAESLKRTAEWYREFDNSGRSPSESQLNDFIVDARNSRAIWIAA